MSYIIRNKYRIKTKRYIFVYRLLSGPLPERCFMLGGVGLFCATVLMCDVVIFSLLSLKKSVVAPVLYCFSAADVGRGRAAPMLCVRKMCSSPRNHNFAGTV